MSILITGGAGYVGSAIAEEAVKSGHHVIVLDNLSQGHRRAVPADAAFIEGDFGDKDLLDTVFSKYSINAVMHIAASTIVSESVTDPAPYFQNNVCNSLILLNKMVEYNVLKIVFSSSCAVYGHPEKTPINENTPKNPINPYGEAKLMFERFLFWYARAYKMDSVALRYFNAAGATECHGEDHSPETHLIPILFQTVTGQRENFKIFGNDYPTPDGTCVRDYVHVADIASAHLLSLNYLTVRPGCHAFNLGNGHGYSVKEICDTIMQICNKKITTNYDERRPGYPPVLVADAKLVREQLGWLPRYAGIETIVQSAWQWQQKHPNGYK
jgi:UDP-glucose 4-epimerase